MTSTGNWRVTVDRNARNWLRVSGHGTGSGTGSRQLGNGHFTMRVEQNRSVGPRTGTITIEATGAPTQRITVTQAGIPVTLALNPNSAWSPSFSGGRRNVTVTSNVAGWTVSTNRDWLSASRTSNNGLVITAKPNPTTTERSGRVTVRAGGVERTINVTQAGRPTLSISPSSDWNIAAPENTRYITVTTNGEGLRFTSDRIWLFIEGADDGRFRITARENRTYSLRSGTITVRVNGAPEQSFRVIQQAPTRTLRWNANGGSVNPTSSDIPIGDRIGDRIGRLPTPTMSGSTFRGWSSTNGETQGRTVTGITRMPSTNVTYWARWHDPGRHLDFWDQTTTNIPFRFTGRDLWRTEMRNGASHWNETDTPISFRETSGTRNTVTVLDRNANPEMPNALGLRRVVSRNETNLTRWEIEMFESPLRDHAEEWEYTLSNVVTNVFVHELGHVIGLRDNPVGRQFHNGSLMNQGTINSGAGRSRDIVPGITPFDIQSVNWLYE